MAPFPKRLLEILWFLFLFTAFLPAQSTMPDRAQIQRLIENHQYASAVRSIYRLEQNAGMQPDLSTTLVDLALNHHFLRRNFDVFYLRDSSSVPGKNATRATENIRYVTIRNPAQLLLRVLKKYPDYAPAYRLYGKYYDLQLIQLSGSKFVEAATRRKIEEKVFTFYRKAARAGSPDPEIHLWLGKYYQKLKQWQTAQEHFLTARKIDGKNSRIYLHLAEIYLNQQRFALAYNAASSALKYLDSNDLQIRYQSMRTAALALQKLGEESQFLSYARKCLDLMPDEQSAYRDIIRFYEDKNDLAAAEKYVYQMLSNNPYELPGFQEVRQIAEKFRNYAFIGRLLNDITVRFEDSPEVMSNVYWLRGGILMDRGKSTEAKLMWQIRRQYSRKVHPADSSFRKGPGDEPVQSLLEEKGRP